MSAATGTSELRASAARVQSHLGRAAAAIESLPPVRVLAALVIVEWLAVLALGLSVRHNGWIYYQGGDQLYYYSLGWLLSHGVLYQTPIGYLWSVVLTPFAAVGGPDLASAMPAIVLFDALVLLPAAMLAVYGIAARLGGRLFGYWTLAVWIAVPFLGILYTNTGYHQKYTELLLPQGFGLSAMADFPTMVAAIVALYFCARVVLAERPQLLDAALGGVAAGCAVAIKPSASLILLGPFFAFAWRRQGRAVAAFLGGLAPFLLALAVWKERGLGYLPLLHHSALGRVSGVAAGVPVFALAFGKYVNLNWSHLGNNIDLLREHFWSGHFAVWLIVAGVIAIGRRSFAAFLLLAGAFLPMLIVKGAFPSSSVEDGSIFRILMPTYPVFVIGLSSLPLLLPRAPRLLRAWQPVLPERWPRLRARALVVSVVVGALVPAVAFAAASRSTNGPRAAYASGTFMPIPVDVNMDLRATVHKDGLVELFWKTQHPGSGLIYRVLRHPARLGYGVTCGTGGGQSCSVEADPVGDTREGARFDRPGRGDFVYRVGILVNWQNSPSFGDLYLTSEPLLVRVP